MFTDKQLISKIKELRTITPSKDWVVFTKKRITGGESDMQVPVFKSNEFWARVGHIFNYKGRIHLVVIKNDEKV